MKRENSDGSVGSDRSDGPGEGRSRRLRPSGGYRKLKSFRTATVIYDGTVRFCERFVGRRSRLVDQMVQAARSGRQNIAEGSRASATSTQTELRLVGVACASLDELLLDYEDFLRQQKLPTWTKDDPQAKAVRAVAQRLPAPSDQSDPTNSSFYAPWLENEDPAVVANALICLIHQENFLLQRQIEGLERTFVTDGGYSELLAAARIAEREKNRADQGDGTASAVECPNCGRPMVLRTARSGRNAGARFWGCTGYPECRGTRRL